MDHLQIICNTRSHKPYNLDQLSRGSPAEQSHKWWGATRSRRSRQPWVRVPKFSPFGESGIKSINHWCTSVGFGSSSVTFFPALGKTRVSPLKLFIVDTVSYYSRAIEIVQHLILNEVHAQEFDFVFWCCVLDCQISWLQNKAKDERSPVTRRTKWWWKITCTVLSAQECPGHMSYLLDLVGIYGLESPE